MYPFLNTCLNRPATNGLTTFASLLTSSSLNSRKEIFFQEGFIHSKEGLSLLVESIKQANEVVTATGRRILQNFLEGPVTDHMKSKAIS